ncbi:MAG: hypothetical protein ACW96U_08725, partial [Candidatus Heimdallarchaeaceae archaeon]
NSKDRTTMKDSSDWTSSITIRALQIAQLMEKDLVNKLDKMRKKRNNLTHRATKKKVDIRKEDVEEMFKVCKLLIKKILETH